MSFKNLYRFEERPTCPKCGSANITARYRTYRIPEIYEYLLISCTCEFFWKMRTKDAAEDLAKENQ